jgi:hypothetical protein
MPRGRGKGLQGLAVEGMFTAMRVVPWEAWSYAWSDVDVVGRCSGEVEGKSFEGLDQGVAGWEWRKLEPTSQAGLEWELQLSMLPDSGKRAREWKRGGEPAGGKLRYAQHPTVVFFWRKLFFLVTITADVLAGNMGETGPALAGLMARTAAPRGRGPEGPGASNISACGGFRPSANPGQRMHPPASPVHVPLAGCVSPPAQFRRSDPTPCSSAASSMTFPQKSLQPQSNHDLGSGGPSSTLCVARGSPVTLEPLFVEPQWRPKIPCKGHGGGSKNCPCRRQ